MSCISSCSRSQNWFLLYLAIWAVFTNGLSYAFEDDDAEYSSGRTLHSSTPSVNSFPYGNCKREIPGQNPYTLSYSGSKELAGGKVRHCFTVEGRDCNLALDCCRRLTDDFWKIEVDVKKECVNAVSQVSFGNMNFNYEQILRTTNNPTGTFRISQLHSNKAKAVGQKFCFVSEAPCASLESLSTLNSTQLKAAIHNNPQNMAKNRCCPLSLIGPVPPTPPPPTPEAPCSVKCTPYIDCIEGTKVNLADYCTVTDGEIWPPKIRCESGKVNVTAVSDQCWCKSSKPNCGTRPFHPDTCGCSDTVHLNPGHEVCRPIVELTCEKAFQCDQGKTYAITEICDVFPTEKPVVVTPKTFTCDTARVLQVSANGTYGTGLGCSASAKVSLLPKFKCVPPVGLNCTTSYKCTEGSTVAISDVCKVLGPNGTEAFTYVEGKKVTEFSCDRQKVTVFAQFESGTQPQCYYQENVQVIPEPLKCIPPVKVECPHFYECTSGKLVNLAAICTVTNGFLVGETLVKCETGGLRVEGKGRGVGDGCEDYDHIFLKECHEPSCNPRVELSCQHVYECTEGETVSISKVCSAPAAKTISPSTFVCKNQILPVSAENGSGPGCEDHESVLIKPKSSACQPPVKAICDSAHVCEQGSVVTLSDVCSTPQGPEGTRLFIHNVQQGLLSNSFTCFDGVIKVTAAYQHRGELCTDTTNITVTSRPKFCYPSAYVDCPTKLACVTGSRVDLLSVCYIQNAYIVGPRYVPCEAGTVTVNVARPGVGVGCNATDTIILEPDTCYCSPKVEVTCPESYHCDLGSKVLTSSICTFSGPNTTYLSPPEFTCRDEYVQITASVKGSHARYPGCTDYTVVDLNPKPRSCKPAVKLDCDMSYSCTEGEVVNTADICMFYGPPGTKLFPEVITCKKTVVSIEARFGDGKDEDCSDKDYVYVHAEPCVKCDPQVEIKCQSSHNCLVGSTVIASDVCDANYPVTYTPASWPCSAKEQRVIARAGNSSCDGCSATDTTRGVPECHPKTSCSCSHKFTCSIGEMVTLKDGPCHIQGGADVQVIPPKLLCVNGTYDVTVTRGDGVSRGCSGSCQVTLEAVPAPCDIHMACTSCLTCTKDSPLIPGSICAIVSDPTGVQLRVDTATCKDGSVTVTAVKGDGNGRGCTVSRSVPVSTTGHCQNPPSSHQ